MNKPVDDPRILGGMEKQLHLRQQRLRSGEKPIGWKVGFGAPASLERLHLDAPLVGFLTDRTLVASAGTVSIAGWTKPAVEPEVAVYLGTDLAGDVDQRATRAAITALGPAIELADLNIPPEDVEQILAGNIYNRHVILGRVDSSRRGGRLDGLVAHIARNDQQLSPVTDLQLLTGNLIDIVSHVARLLSTFGEALRAGEFVIAGSIIPPLWAEANETITYTLAPIDTIAIRLA